MCIGIGTVSALVFSPDANRAGSNLAAFFLAFVMHGLVAAASLRGGYYPRMLAGSYLGEHTYFGVVCGPGMGSDHGAWPLFRI